MTQTQFVEFAGRGFWAYDVALGVFLKHLIDVALARGDVDAEWLSEAVGSWRVVACISDFGLIVGDTWSPGQRAAFLDLADEACSNLAQREAIPADEIDGWQILEDQRIFVRGVSAVHTGPVVELGRAIIDLVSGHLPEPPAGTIWFYGTPRGRETLATRPADPPG